MAHQSANEVELRMHEMYFKNGEPDDCTMEAVTIAADDIKGIKWTLKMMKKALKEPVIWYGDRYPEVYVEEIEEEIEKIETPLSSFELARREIITKAIKMLHWENLAFDTADLFLEALFNSNCNIRINGDFNTGKSAIKLLLHNDFEKQMSEIEGENLIIIRNPNISKIAVYTLKGSRIDEEKQAFLKLSSSLNRLDNAISEFQSV